MSQETRKLAAIMFTDIVGYSALMSRDEKLAMEVLEKNRAIHKTAIDKFHGQYIKEIGDGTLSIFPSSVDAVNCALEIQKSCCAEPDFRIRIGIHTGDIIFEDNDVFGDGVNIASRIESTGEPGGIYFSEKVYDDIRNKTDLQVEYIGEKELKNIGYPIKIYALQPGSPIPEIKAHLRPGKVPAAGKRKYILIISLLIFVITTIAVIFLVRGKKSPDLNENLIAVAVFDNQTGDRSLDPVGRMASDWITQGIAESGLVSVVPAIAITLTETKNNNNELIGLLAEETQAKTIITGVYYKQGDRIQLYSQMVNAGNGEVLSAIGPVDGPASNPLQSVEIIRQKILGAMATHFDPRFRGYSDRLLNPPSYDSYKEFLAGLESFFKSDHEEAIVHFKTAYQLDTNNLSALNWICVSNMNDRGYYKVDSLLPILNAKRNKMTTGEQYYLDFIMADHQRDLEGIYKASRAAAKYAPIFEYQQCYDAVQANHPQAAVDKLVTLMPDKLHFPGWYWNVLGYAYHMLGKYKEQLKVAREGRKNHPELFSMMYLELMALAALGRTDETDRLLAESLSMPKPNDWTPGTPGWLMLMSAQEFRAHGYKEEAEKIIDRSIKWFTSHPDIKDRFYLAEAYYVAEQWGKSKEIIDKLLEEEPDNFRYMAYDGLIAARTGNLKRSTEVDSLLANINPLPISGWNTSYRARIAAVLGEKEKAIEMLHNLFSEGLNSWRFDIYLPELMDFESLKDYPPFLELFKPKG